MTTHYDSNVWKLAQNTSSTSIWPPDEAKVTDVFLKLDVDFDRHDLDGSVTLTVEKVKPEATHVVSQILVHSAAQEIFYFCWKFEANNKPEFIHIHTCKIIIWKTRNAFDRDLD